MMRFIITIKMALRALRRNTMRSILTALGIIIGIGAVITIVSMGNGAKARVEAQVAALGQNIITVYPGSFSSGGMRDTQNNYILDGIDNNPTELAGAHLRVTHPRLGHQVVVQGLAQRRGRPRPSRAVSAATGTSSSPRAGDLSCRTRRPAGPSAPSRCRRCRCRCRGDR